MVEYECSKSSNRPCTSSRSGKYGFKVFKLFVKNTIEEKIERLQQRKRDLTEAIVQEGETFITQLSSEELTALFESDDNF